MKIFVFGGSGRTGTLLVPQLLAAGHSVSVLVRNPAAFTIPAQERLEIVVGDVLVPATWEASIAGKDLIMSTLGSRTLKAEGIYSSSYVFIVEAMRKHGVSRLVFVTADFDRPDAAWFFRNVVKKLILADIAADITQLHAYIKTVTDIAWTVVMPYRQVDEDKTEYVLGEPERPIQPCSFLTTRAAVASFLLNRAWADEYKHRFVTIASPA
jgi:hypothetical protein